MFSHNNNDLWKSWLDTHSVTVGMNFTHTKVNNITVSPKWKSFIFMVKTWVKVGVRYGLVYLWWLKGIHDVNPQNDRRTSVWACTWSHSVATSPSKSCFSWITICFSSYSCSNCISNCLSYTQHVQREEVEWVWMSFYIVLDRNFPLQQDAYW